MSRFVSFIKGIISGRPGSANNVDRLISAYEQTIIDLRRERDYYRDLALRDFSSTGTDTSKSNSIMIPIKQLRSWSQASREIEKSRKIAVNNKLASQAERDNK